MNPHDVVVLTDDVLSVQKASDAVAREDAGAISLFVGTTRDCFEGKRVLRLEYEAYHDMAVREMHALCAAARVKRPKIAAIAVMHRVGVVPVGEISVIIAVSSPHRIDAIGKVIQVLCFVACAVMLALCCLRFAA